MSISLCMIVCVTTSKIEFHSRMLGSVFLSPLNLLFLLVKECHYISSEWLFPTPLFLVFFQPNNNATTSSNGTVGPVLASNCCFFVLTCWNESYLPTTRNVVAHKHEHGLGRSPNGQAWGGSRFVCFYLVVDEIVGKGTCVLARGHVLIFYYTILFTRWQPFS